MATSIKVKVSPKTGDPVKGELNEKTTLNAHRAGLDSNLDVRDRLAELVGKGNVLLPEDKVAIYGNLVATLGQDKAQKVMNHAFLFNQRPDVQKLPLEEKLKAFYTIGSNDPDVSQLIAKSKALGYGVLPGLRGSVSDLNQAIQGGVPTKENVAVNPEIRKRVMVKVAR